jgi:hypothetical protein
MPKIRDLGISAIPYARRTETGRGAGQYWMCSPSPSNPEGAPEEECRPTPPKCHPTVKPQCNPTSPSGPGPGKKDEPEKPTQQVGGLPHDAVSQLKQQLQHQISRQLQG